MLHQPAFALFATFQNIIWTYHVMILAILMRMVEFSFVCVFETAPPTNNESVSVYARTNSLCYFSQYHLAKLNLSVDVDGQVRVC